MLKAAVIAAILPAGLAAQAGERLVCRDGAEPVGSLGITGIACDRCQFFTNGKVHRAVFWTEPTILNLDDAHPAAGVLRKGDVLVAVDERLITTSEGSARFSALPPDGPTRLRIRRDGRLMEVSVPVSEVCPESKGTDMPAVAGRGMPAPPAPPIRSASEPPAPGTRTPPARPSGISVVAPAPPPAPAPEASLGFGFRCSNCGYSMGGVGTGRWTFPEPPEVVGVQSPEGARASGLRVGDRLIALGGVDLTTEEGGRRFAAVSPGDRLVWTVERDGRRLDVTTMASEPSRATTSAPSLAGDPSRAPLRFSGTVGNTTVEVRGGRVSVTEDEGGRLVIIRTGDTEIRIRAPAGEGG